MASSGARTPGVDGVDKQALEGNLPGELERMREELLAGTFQPLPARRVYIPKANGKLRPLGIPCLQDRIVQRAMLMAMEPIWESDFHRASHGFTDFTATVFGKLDRVIFWKFWHWLAHKYRASVKSLMRRHVRSSDALRAKTWVMQGRNNRGMYCEVALRRLVTSRKGQFRWRNPEGNPYLCRDEERSIFESRYDDVAFAMSNA